MKRAQQTIVVDEDVQGVDDAVEKRIKRLRTFSSDEANGGNVDFIPLVVPHIEMSPNTTSAVPTASSDSSSFASTSAVDGAASTTSLAEETLVDVLPIPDSEPIVGQEAAVEEEACDGQVIAREENSDGISAAATAATVTRENNREDAEDAGELFLSAQQPSIPVVESVATERQEKDNGEEETEEEEEEGKEEKEKLAQKGRKNKQLSPASRLAARIDAVRKATTAVKRSTLPPVLFSDVEHFAVFVTERDDAEVWRRSLSQSEEMQREDERLCNRFFSDVRTRRRVEQRHRTQFKDIDWTRIIDATRLIRVPMPFICQNRSQGTTSQQQGQRGQQRDEQQQGNQEQLSTTRYIYIIVVLASRLCQSMPVTAANSTKSLRRAIVLRRCAFIHAAFEQKSTFLYVGDSASLIAGIESLSAETSTAPRIVRAFCSVRNSNAQHFVERWHSLPALLLAERMRMRVSNRNASNLRCWLSASLNAQAVRERNGSTDAPLADGEPRITSLDIIEKHLGCIARNIMPSDFVVVFNDILIQFQQIASCECSMPIETTTPGLMVDACRLSFILFMCHRLCTRNIDATVLAMADESMPPPPPAQPSVAALTTTSVSSTSNGGGGRLAGNFVRPFPPLHHLASAIRQIRQIAIDHEGEEAEGVVDDVEEDDQDNDVPSPPPPAQRIYSTSTNNSQMRHHIRPAMSMNHRQRQLQIHSNAVVLAAARHAMRPSIHSSSSGGGGNGNGNNSSHTLKKRVPDEPAGPNDAQCVICLSNRARYASVPCGHLCMCGECKRDLKHQPGGLVRCPLCKASTKSTVCIYIPMKTEPSACASTSNSDAVDLLSKTTKEVEEEVEKEDDL